MLWYNLSRFYAQAEFLTLEIITNISSLLKLFGEVYFFQLFLFNGIIQRRFRFKTSFRIFVNHPSLLKVRRLKAVILIEFKDTQLRAR